MRCHTLVPILATLCLVSGCQSSRQHTVGNICWVYGHPFPWCSLSIRQTNLEINFSGSVDVMLQDGLRSQLRRTVSVTIDPIAMWTVFSYPTNTPLEIEPEVHEDIAEMSGWVLEPDGSLRDASNTNKTQSIVVRQKEPGASEATATLTMLLRVSSAGSTNFTTGVLPCIWHDGTLQNRGLKLEQGAR